MPNVHLPKERRKSFWSQLRELSHIARDWLRKVRRRVRKALMVDEAAAALRRTRIMIAYGAVQRARRGCRIAVLGRAIGSFSRLQPPDDAHVCEINSVADFQAGCARLAPLLGQLPKPRSPGELEFLQSIPRRRKTWYTGSIAPEDYFFLTAVIGILAPARVVEIGTQTGFSTGLIAAALAHGHGSKRANCVDTIDRAAQCVVDQTRPTGFEIPEVFGEFASMIRVHAPQDARFVSQIAEPNELELAFIDADHRHPLPLLDLLQLAPCMRPASWVLLHDIRLGTLTRQALDAGCKPMFAPAYGAEWLFAHWPFPKISGGTIGVVQLPMEKGALISFALRLMTIPFEITGRHEHATRTALCESLGALC
jgi:predicted O-methyltransferase YrrM